MSSIISIKNIGKKYSIGVRNKEYLTLRDAIAGILHYPFRWITHKFFQKDTEDFWALHDINLEIEKGETIGIIGANGAGKSTLLKILSRITYPSNGEIHIRGRVSSLLEVGTGFHPELTGRENIYLNGAILGMTRKEIDRKFSQIVDFSGIDQFLDTPVKRYSSGMQVRLAFSVAAHLEPDILIVDEVLAVGDADFQRKSLGKMEEVTKQDGRTILFVSHNMDAISKLCTRSVLLEKGRIKMQGKTEDVIAHYLNTYGQHKAEVFFDDKTKKKPVQVRSVRVFDIDNNPQTRFEVGQPFKIEITYELPDDAKNAYIGVAFIDMKTNAVILNTLDVDVNQEAYIQRDRGVYTSTFNFKNPFFNEGSVKLFVHAGIFPGSRQNLHLIDGEIVLSFIGTDNFSTKTLDGKRNSIFLLQIPCSIDRVDK